MTRDPLWCLLAAVLACRPAPASAPPAPAAARAADSLVASAVVYADSVVIRVIPGVRPEWVWPANDTTQAAPFWLWVRWENTAPFEGIGWAMTSSRPGRGTLTQLVAHGATTVHVLS